MLALGTVVIEIGLSRSNGFIGSTRSRCGSTFYVSCQWAHHVALYCERIISIEIYISSDYLLGLTGD